MVDRALLRAARSRHPPGHRRPPRGFSLLELLVAVAILGIVSAVAIPNMVEALDRTRRSAAYASVRQLDAVMQNYMIVHDAPPEDVDPATLQELVAAQAMTEQQAAAILSTLEEGEFWWYWAPQEDWWWWPWGYYYEFGFRPKGEPDPASFWVMIPEGVWRWSPDDGWHEPY